MSCEGVSTVSLLHSPCFVNEVTTHSTPPSPFFPPNHHHQKSSPHPLQTKRFSTAYDKHDAGPWIGAPQGPQQWIPRRVRAKASHHGARTGAGCSNTIMTEVCGTSQRGKTEDAAGASKTSQSSPWVAQLVHNHRDGASWWPGRTPHGRCRSFNTRMCVREIRAGSSQKSSIPRLLVGAEPARCMPTSRKGSL